MKRNARKQMVKDLDTIERMVQGWVSEPCTVCDGKGYKEHPKHPPFRMKCRICKGSGVVWVKKREETRNPGGWWIL